MVSIQLLVSVRDWEHPVFITVGLFQYNCLCRFERKNGTKNTCFGLSFNTTACVGSRAYSFIRSGKYIEFQYNCLCRFEISKKIKKNIVCCFNTTACVGSRNSADMEDIAKYSFNTTACVGSRTRKGGRN